MGTEILSMFEDLSKDFIKFLPKLFIALIVILIFFFLSGKIAKMIKNKLASKTEDVLLSGFIGKISKWTVRIIGFIFGMEILGFANLAGGIITGAGLSAVILGFAFKNIGENFLSGLLLAFNRPFRVGDTINTEGFTGSVTSMDFRTTSIKTMDGQDVFIPNSMIINNPLSNFTFKSGRRFDFTIQVDYTNDVDLVKKIIYDSLLEVSEIQKEPLPLVVVDELTTSISIKTYYWLDTKALQRNVLEIRSNVIELSRKNLNDAGVTITDVTQIRVMNEAIPLQINSQSK